MSMWTEEKNNFQLMSVKIFHSIYCFFFNYLIFNTLSTHLCKLFFNWKNLFFYWSFLAQLSAGLAYFIHWSLQNVFTFSLSFFANAGLYEKFLVLLSYTMRFMCFIWRLKLAFSFRQGSCFAPMLSGILLDYLLSKSTYKIRSALTCDWKQWQN